MYMGNPGFGKKGGVPISCWGNRLVDSVVGCKMAKPKKDHIVKRCSNCNGEFMDWVEKCPDCGNPDLRRYLICPACWEGQLPVQESMASSCPICAYVPARGKQDPVALKSLLEAKLKFMDDEDTSVSGSTGKPFHNLAANLGMGASPHELTSAPWFRVLVPLRERVLIQARVYGIAIPLMLLVGFAAVLVGGGQKPGFVATAITVSGFLLFRNRILTSQFSKAFAKNWRLLAEETDSCPQ